MRGLKHNEKSYAKTNTNNRADNWLLHSDLVSDAVSHVVERAAAKILAANERFRASLDPPLNDSHGGMFFCLHAEELPISLV